jgi:hypothetical protein
MKHKSKHSAFIPAKYKIIWFSPVIIIACIVKYPDWRKSWLLERHGHETIAVIELSSTGGIRSEFDDKNVLFTYRVNGKQYKGLESCPVNQNYVFNPMGLPVTAGQKYRLTYYPGDPSISRLELGRPLAENIVTYLRDVIKEIAAADEFSKMSPMQHFCLAVSIFRLYGFSGWASIIFRNEYLLENLSHNGYTYRSLIRSDDFQKVLKECNAQTFSPDAP